MSYKNAANHYYAVGWQPDWDTAGDGVTQGFPRFGSDEANGNQLDYFLITPGSAYTEAANLIAWDSITDNASYLAAGAIALASLVTF